MKARLKKLIPVKLLNAILLNFPMLYSSSVVRYESNFQNPDDLQELLAQLEATFTIPGDVIECGSSRCGTSAIMALFLRKHSIKKMIFACDSFEGFDRQELAREFQARLTTTKDDAFTSTSYDYVKRKLAILRLENAVTPVKGYFQETLPHIDGPFSFALIDCDLKDSLLYAAETIWPRLSSGGLMLFDDYLADEFKGARLAVDQFVESRLGELAQHGLLKHFYYAQKPKKGP